MKNIITILISFLICSCGVNYVDDRPEAVAWIESDVSPMFIYKYTDSVEGTSWSFPPENKFVSEFDMQESNREIVNVQAYYFSPPHEEIYRVKFTWPMVIENVYSDSAKKVLGKKDMTASEIQRVQERFKNEILEPMVQWGREKGIPDSVIFN